MYGWDVMARSPKSPRLGHFPLSLPGIVLSHRYSGSVAAENGLWSRVYCGQLLIELALVVQSREIYIRVAEEIHQYIYSRTISRQCYFDSSVYFYTSFRLVLNSCRGDHLKKKLSFVLRNNYIVNHRVSSVSKNSHGEQNRYCICFQLIRNKLQQCNFWLIAATIFPINCRYRNRLKTRYYLNYSY